MTDVDELGYSGRATLVRVKGSALIHFRAGMDDVVWMMLPERRGANPSYEEDLASGCRAQDAKTVCGLTIADHTYDHDHAHCEVCWGPRLGVALAQLRLKLMARWEKALPDLPRQRAHLHYIQHYDSATWPDIGEPVG